MSARSSLAPVCPAERAREALPDDPGWFAGLVGEESLVGRHLGWMFSDFGHLVKA
jgi:hypothetical protein